MAWISLCFPVDHRASRLLSAIGMMFLIGLIHPVAAPGATFTVTSTADDGAGSLRMAIEQANLDAIMDTIAFAIGGGGHQVIQPLIDLPTITQPVRIDGWSQGGGSYTGPPLIELDGSQAGISYGLLIHTGNCSVRGLIINRFNGVGIYLWGGSGSTIEANYIGTDSAGTVALPNTGSGVYLSDSNSNTIGGASLAARNLISGNTGNGSGVYLWQSDDNQIQNNYIGTDVSGSIDLGNARNGVAIINSNQNVVLGNLISGNGLSGLDIFGVTATADANIVQGNLIGTNAAGTIDLGNGSHGINIELSSNNLIGGPTPESGNIVCGNEHNGVLVYGSTSSGNIIQGNHIGTDLSGTIAMGNTINGVLISGGALLTTVGGIGDGEGNVIAFNTGDGILVYDNATTTNSLLGNSLFSNYILGIDLYPPYGPTFNDADDTDSGCNDLQNFPVLSAGVCVAGLQITSVQGLLTSLPDQTYRVEFFHNPTRHGTQYGEGKSMFGFLDVLTNSAGTASFSLQLPLMPMGYLAATATNPQGSTSEFSADLLLACGGTDTDGDGYADPFDCDTGDPTSWSWPSPAWSLMIAKTGPDNITWRRPYQLGGQSPVVYDVLRSVNPADFSAATCLVTDSLDLKATDDQVPFTGGWYYLVRVENECGSAMGTNSSGNPRTGIACTN